MWLKIRARRDLVYIVIIGSKPLQDLAIRLHTPETEVERTQFKVFRKLLLGLLLLPMNDAVIDGGHISHAATHPRRDVFGVHCFVSKRARKNLQLFAARRQTMGLLATAQLQSMLNSSQKLIRRG